MSRLSPEILSSFREAARKFAHARLAAEAAHRDRTRELPPSLLSEVGEAGYFGLTVPQAWGGSEAGHEALSVVVEEIAAVDGVMAMLVLSANTNTNGCLVKHGTEAQKEAFLKPLATGQKLAGFALTEAGSGSDAFKMQTVAHREDDSYVLRGEKHFISFGSLADYVIVFARTSMEAPATSAFSAFLVPTDSPGYLIVRKEQTFGMCSGDTCQITLDDVRVPSWMRIGQEGEGYSIALSQIVESRIAVAAQSIGIARAALRIAGDYTAKRQVFGKPILLHQGPLFRMADLRSTLFVCRAASREVARQLDRGEDVEDQAAMVKLFVTERCEEIVRQAMQLMGAHGYTLDCPMERLSRDIRACSIYEGTSDLLRTLVGNSLLNELRSSAG